VLCDRLTSNRLKVNIIQRFEKHRKLFWSTVGFALIVLLGAIDYLTGYEMAFSLFYLIPITLVAWFAGSSLGIVISVAGAISWLIADVTAGHIYTSLFIPTWNTITRLGFFLIITFLLSILKKALEHEKELARIDDLTGAANRRAFYEIARMEINRSARYKHPFTVAYVDLDSFKAINDTYGHNVGDILLRTVVGKMRMHLRSVDMVARLGGDEFAVLLPETGPEAAQIAVEKLQRELLTEMQNHHWPVTFSIGVLTCSNPLSTVDVILKLADSLMYTVKNSGKNGIIYSVYSQQ
jgi:diguanylate cyclase (GGDEF)-like protein